MTIQRGEVLTINQAFYVTLASGCEPLKKLIDKEGILVPDRNKMSRLWRGYTGLWHIANDQLKLEDVLDLDDESILSMFPVKQNCVAVWYSGVLDFDLGEVIEFCPIGGEQLRYLIEIQISDGLVESYCIIDRTNSSQNLSENSISDRLLEILAKYNERN